MENIHEQFHYSVIANHKHGESGQHDMGGAPDTHETLRSLLTMQGSNQLLTLAQGLAGLLEIALLT